MAMTGQTGQLTTSDPLALTGEKGGSGGETLSDMSMRRRIQNRNAQRNFRTRQREAKEFQQQQQQAAAAAAAATAAAAASTVPPISLNTTAPILQQNPTPSPSYTSEVYIPPATLGASDAAYDSLWLPQFNSAIDYCGLSMQDPLSQPLDKRTSLSGSNGSSGRLHKGGVPDTSAKSRRITDDILGRTALHIAVECEHDDIIRLLLQHDRQQYTISDNQGRTPLHIAAKRGNKETLSELLAMDSLNCHDDAATRIIDAQDNNGHTALHIATDNGHAAIVRELLGYGANPNNRDCTGRSPLHIATLRGDAVLVNILLEGGADIYLRTSS